jgi:hypothetical protein
MPAERIDETLLRKYLLGDLSEDEQVDVEDRAFADQEFLRALEAAEADLIDAWVRGDLSPSERRAFERQFLVSPQRRNKVDFARALAKVLSESKPAEAPRKTFWRWPFGMQWTPALQWAAGLAILLCVAATTWFAIENAAMRSRTSALEARLDQQARDRSMAAAPAVASLVLLPGLSRSEARVPQLSLDPAAQVVRIEVRLEPRDNYQRFRAELRTRRGDEVLTLANLSRRQTTTGYGVLVEAPASVLPPGQYELELKGAKGSSTEDVGFYYFNIDRK